ncbi:MAG: hypothetical protein WCX61_03750 [Candidatus Peribacteraceae bacterium]|jgi:hypothetical protein
MSALSLLEHPADLSAIALRFLPWYFLKVPGRIIRGYGAYVRALGEIFSFWFLIRTFLKPWKSIVDRYPDRGFNLGLIAQAFTLNCTSRVIGMIFRTVAFVLGVVMEIIVLGVFLVLLFVWILFPFVFVLDIFYLIGALP